MARPSTPPAERLRELNKALEKAKKLPRKTTLTARPMCELLGVSWPTLLKWCDEIPGFATSNAFTRGAQGIEWTFRPVATITAIVKHYTAVSARSAAKAKRVRNIVSGGTLDDVGEGLTIEELTKMVRLTAEVQAMKERDGQRVDAAKAAAAVTMFCSTVQQVVLRAAQEEDQTGQWPPEIRESFENATRRILLRVEQAGQDCLRSLRGNAAQSS